LAGAGESVELLPGMRVCGSAGTADGVALAFALTCELTGVRTLVVEGGRVCMPCCDDQASPREEAASYCMWEIRPIKKDGVLMQVAASKRTAGRRARIGSNVWFGPTVRANQTI
jgi:hypothetical protein